MTVTVYQRNLKEDSNYNLGEIVKTQLNNNSIIPILSDSIYKDPLSAIRELYANEVTSCKISELKTRIEIRLNSDNRELIIQGFNSTGITREIFEKLLTVMGNSGNNNSKNTGLFGLGFFSHVKLSEKLICHSYSQTGEYFSFISKSGLSFEILPDNLIEKLDQFGSKMVLNVKDEIDLDKLVLKIKQIIELSPIETKFILDNNDMGIKQFKSLKAKMQDDFKNILSVKYSTVSMKIYENFNDIYDLILVEKFPTTYRENKNNCYLLNVPISIDLNEIIDNYAIKYCNVYLNIKDEHEFLPHVSRDYLTSESESKISKLILNDLDKLIKYEARFKLNKDNKISLIEYYNDNSRYFKLNSSTFNVKTLFDKKAYDFIKQFTLTLENLDPDYEIKGITFLDTYNKKIMQEIFDLGYLSFVIVRSKYAHSTYANDLFYDITDIQTIFKENNIKRKLGIKHILKSNSKVFSKSNEPKYIFKVENPKMKISYTNDLLGFSYLTSKKDDHYDISDIQDILQDEIFLTNNGYISFSEIKKNCNVIFCYNGIIHNYIKNIDKEKQFIFSDNKLFCQLLNLYFELDRYEQKNLFISYLNIYNFKNENIKNLISNHVIDINNIRNYDMLQKLLSLDYSFDLRKI